MSFLPEYLIRFGRLLLLKIDPRDLCGGIDFRWKSEDALGNDVLEYFLRSDPQRHRRTEPISVIPIVEHVRSAVTGLERRLVFDQSSQTLSSLGEFDDALAVGCGHHFPRRGFGAGWPRVHAITQRAIGQQAQQFAFNVDLCGLVLHQGIVDRSVRDKACHQVSSGRPRPPDRPGLGQRNSFGLQLRHGQKPAVAVFPEETVGGHPHIIEKDFVVFILGAAHVDDWTYRYPGSIHVDEEFRETRMFCKVGIGACDQNSDLRFMSQRGPDLVATNNVVVAIASRGRPKCAEIRTTRGFAEQHAPDLLERQRRRKKPLPLGFRAVRQKRLRAIIDRYRIAVLGRNKARAGNFFIDDDLKLGIRAEPPGSGPVRHRVARLGELTAARLGVTFEPFTHFYASWIVFERQSKIHRRHLGFRLVFKKAPDPASRWPASKHSAWRPPYLAGGFRW